MKSVLIALVLITIFYACKKPGRDCKQELIGTVKDYTGKLDGCKMMIELKNGTRLEVHSIPAGITLIDGKDVALTYTPAPNTLSVCMAGIVADITALRYL